MAVIHGQVVLPGTASGPLLRLDGPISFWGGIDPDSGSVSDPRHPQYGQAIGGTILVIPSTIGSSSSSAIMLELLRNGHAPAALVLGNIDAIVTLGVVVGQEMGYGSIPVIALDHGEMALLTSGGEASLDENGILRTQGAGPSPGNPSMS